MTLSDRKGMAEMEEKLSDEATRLRLALGKRIEEWQQQIIIARDVAENARGIAERVRAREQAALLEMVCGVLLKIIASGSPRCAHGAEDPRQIPMFERQAR